MIYLDMVLDLLPEYLDNAVHPSVDHIAKMNWLGSSFSWGLMDDFVPHRTP